MNYDSIITYIKDNDIVLDKPIVFFDLETTGTDILTDRIIQLGAIKINPDYTTDSYKTLVNPERHIPDDASTVNCICDDDVKNSPKFAEVADVFNAFVKGCDFGGYNITSFDIPLLIEEYKRCGKNFKYGKRRIIDAFKILIKAEPRDLKTTYKNFTGEELKDAHDACSDAFASANVAFRQVSKYGFKTLDELSNFGNEGMVDIGGFFKRDKNNTIVFALGKYKGKSVVDIYNSKTDEYYFEKYIKTKCSSDVNTHLNLIISGAEK